MSAKSWNTTTLTVPTTASTTTYGTSGNGIIYLPAADTYVILAQLTAGSVSTLNVYIQESWNQGTTWEDVAAFVQLTAAQTKNYRLVLPSAGTATTVGVGTVSSAAPALAAGSFADGPWGPWLRLVSVTGSGANAATVNQVLHVVAWRQSMGVAQ